MSIYNRWTYFNAWLNKVYFCIVVANGLDTYYILYMGKTWSGKNWQLKGRSPIFYLPIIYNQLYLYM